MTVDGDATIPTRDAAGAESPARMMLTVVAGVVAGLAAFFTLGFNCVLAPHNVSWILRYTDAEWYYDPATSLLAWQYFRHTPWQLPLGLNQRYGLEFGGSIVYSDSLPLLAFFFKLFTHWLGTNFQYTGLWVLICFLMQGVFAALLASKFVSGLLPRLLIAAFFAFSPILQERGWSEYSLMSQWLLLWGIYLYFTERTHRVRWVWIVPPVVALTTSFYFVPMVLLLWLADAIKSLFRRTLKIRWFLLEGAAILAAVLGGMWLTGYFVISVQNAGTPGFGTYAANVLGPIDPWAWSTFLREQPHSPYWHGEGFCYLGLGMILLCAIALYEWVQRPTGGRAMLRILPLGLVMVGLAAFSFSNEVALGSHVLLLPNIWGNLGPIFRASGRMIWPAYYGLWLAAFYLTMRGLRPWRASVVLAVLLAVQLVDLWPTYSAMHDKYSLREKWHLPLHDAFWESAMHDYRQICIVPSGRAVAYVPLAYLGAAHKVPTNSVYVNRYPGGDVIGPISDARLNALLGDKPDRATLYVVPENDRFANIARGLSPAHGIGRIDGYNVIAPFWFDGGKPLAPGSVVPAGGPAAQAIVARLGPN
jgi:hypothetical protein